MGEFRDIKELFEEKYRGEKIYLSELEDDLDRFFKFTDYKIESVNVNEDNTEAMVAVIDSFWGETTKYILTGKIERGYKGDLFLLWDKIEQKL